MKYLFSFLFIVTCYNLYAQDKNVLAKIAYEDAEAAYNSGDYSKTITELQKVDEHLGKITPKVQYLRVQAWNLAVAGNVANLDGAISACKTYLDLSKSYEVPEEKVMEVTRLLLKLQNDKEVVNQRKIAAEEEHKKQEVLNEKTKLLIPELVKIIDSLSFEFTNYMPGETLEQQKQKNPDLSSFIKKHSYYNSMRQNHFQDTNYTNAQVVYSEELYRKKGVMEIEWNHRTNKINFLKDILELKNTDKARQSELDELKNKEILFREILNEKLNTINLLPLTYKLSINQEELLKVQTDYIQFQSGKNYTYISITDKANPQNNREFVYSLSGQWQYKFIYVSIGTSN